MFVKYQTMMSLQRLSYNGDDMTKIGILDSGVGGLSILGAVRQRLPRADILYLADTANFPYGEKTAAEVAALTERGIEYLARRGYNDAIVVACNTASVSGLDSYRRDFPGQRLIGVTPLLDEARRATKTGKIVLLATFATIASDYLEEMKSLASPDQTIYAHAAFEWVRMVEAGQIDDGLVTAQVKTFARFGVDTVVLGCTHFAFLAPAIKAAVPTLQIIEPSPTIAADLAAAVTDIGSGQTIYEVTGDAKAFSAVATKLLGRPIRAVRSDRVNVV